MRRRSTRSSVKSSPEKPLDSSSTKSRRYSKKRRSSQSSEETDDKTAPSNEIENSNSEENQTENKTQKGKVKLIRTKSSSGNHEEESSNNHEDQNDNKQIRSLRRNSNKEDQEECKKKEETEESEEVGSKGKSKHKHKSKSDKTRQVSESDTHTQSEISENAQVTPQSPIHSSTNNPIDSVTSDEVNKDRDDSDDKLSKGNDPSGNEAKDDENVEKDTETTETVGLSQNQRQSLTDDRESGEMETEDSHVNNFNEVQNDLHENRMQTDETPVENEMEYPAQETRTSEEVTEEAGSTFEQQDESMDTSEQENPSEKESSFDITTTCNEDIQELVTSNAEIQKMKSEISSMFQTPGKVVRRRKWGNSMVGLDLMKSSLSKIDMDTIKTFCPNVEFLEEDEVKLEVKERRKSVPTPEPKAKKFERKVSLDYKFDGEHPKFERRMSANSDSEHVEPETDNSHIIAMNRKISIVDDTASKLRPPPSPAKNPISEILFITNLVRPFTLKQLKDLLERTGRIRENGFWTDRVKSKCYVYYETKEEAEATRNALHGVNWPVGNAKKLCIEYATSEDLENARNPPPPIVIPATPPKPIEIIEKENKIIPKPIKEDDRMGRTREKEKLRNNVREWDSGKESNRRRSYSREKEEREKRRHRRSLTPLEYIKRKQFLKEAEDIPQKRMDDLFRKTKASPSIYWLPLTPEEIAIKEQQRLQRMAEHKRRMEESSSSRSRAEHGRGAAYRRRY